MHGRWVRAILVGLAASSVATASQADRSVESIGVGLALAMPAVAGPSLLLKFDDRWAGGLAVGRGVQVQINYSRENSRGGYWTVGGGRGEAVSIVRGGYGYAWQLDAFRLHVEATLNVPFNFPERQGLGGFAEGAGYAFPIGLGVHYVFGKR